MRTTRFFQELNLVWLALALVLLSHCSVSTERSGPDSEPFESQSAAVTSQEDVCEQVSKKAGRAIWDSVRKSADEHFCRKPWVDRTRQEFLACAASNNLIRFGNRLKDHWNAFFASADDEWATWGPRGIGPDCEVGTIVGGFKRTFFGAGLASTTSTVEVTKTGGQAQAHVTVCELDYDGNVLSSHRREFASGQANLGQTQQVQIPHDDTRILGIVVDTPLSTNAFSYQAILKTHPSQNDIVSTDGMADLHVHQTADLAFAGRFYWGSHTGDKATSLAKEKVTGLLGGNLGSEDIDLFPEILNIALPIPELQPDPPPLSGLDANVLMKAVGGTESDEGFFTLGTAGYPGFESWPHHADRSHQQVHISWLQEAHNRGLNLIVVSLVHNDVLCTVLKRVDPYGNVSKRDPSGQLVDGQYESQNWQCTDHENVLRQLEALHELERTYPWYHIAMTPWHARQIIADGGLAVVVSLETDKLLSGESGTYGDVVDQLDEYRALGVSTMPLVHESNSPYCGAAPHRTMMSALQFVHNPLESIVNTTSMSDLLAMLVLPTPLDVAWTLATGSPFDIDTSSGKVRNRLGLTTPGKALVDAMVARNMPIDLAHGSEQCRLGIMSHVPAGYGLYDSHTKFERLLPPDVLDREKEFAVTDGLIDDYVSHDVLVGLRTSSVDALDAPGAVVPNTCPGSTRSFAQHVQFAHELGLKIAFGTDFNTGVSQLGPRHPFAGDYKDDRRCYAAKFPGKLGPDPSERMLDADGKVIKELGKNGQEDKREYHTTEEIDGTNYYDDGLATIAWLPEVAHDLQFLGAPGADQLATQSAQSFIEMWERSYSAAPAASSCQPPLPEELGETCYGDAECVSGRCSSEGGFLGQCVCDDDADCGGGEFCNMGLDLKLNACEPLRADDATCTRAESCRSGYCNWGRCYTPNSLDDGQACFVSKACKSGKCNNVVEGAAAGTCVCDDDGDCAPSEFCNGGVDFSKNACEPLKPTNATCTRADSCLSGYCTWGRCYVPSSLNIGQTCYVSAACKSGECNNATEGAFAGTCVCDGDNDCASTQYCDSGVDLTQNACKSKKVNDSTCARAGQCSSGFCGTGRCYAPSSVGLGGTCYVNAACKSGKCSSAANGIRGTCVCDGDNDCDGGYWCDAGLDLNKNVCREKYDLGEVCGTVGELGVGHRCKSGSCKVSGLSTKLKCVK